MSNSTDISRRLRLMADSIDERTTEHPGYFKMWTRPNLPPLVQKWFDDTPNLRDVLLCIWVPAGAETLTDWDEVSGWNSRWQTKYMELDGGTMVILWRD